MKKTIGLSRGTYGYYRVMEATAIIAGIRLAVTYGEWPYLVACVSLVTGLELFRGIMESRWAFQDALKEAEDFFDKKDEEEE